MNVVKAGAMVRLASSMAPRILTLSDSGMTPAPSYIKRLKPGQRFEPL